MKRRRLELPRHNWHYPLKVARLPIPPPLQLCFAVLSLVVRAQNRTRTCTSWNTRTWNERVYHSATWAWESSWAENETRTRDPNLGKVVLYQLSYFRKGFSEKHALLAEMRVQRYAIFLNGQKKCVTFLRRCRKILGGQGCMSFLWGDNIEVIDILCVL